MAYDPQVISAIDRVLNRLNASPRVRKAAYEAAIVESGVKNLNYGDRDSLGVFQQRPSQGWGTAQQVTDPTYAAEQFVTRAIKANATGRYRSAGQLAQAVQRSAFPGRYDQQGRAAEQILAGLGGGSGGDYSPDHSSGGAPSSAGGVPSIVDGGQAGDYTSLLASLLSQPQQQAAPVQVQAPSFSAAPPLPQGFRAPMASVEPQPQQQDRVSQALGLLGTLGGSGPTIQSPDVPAAADGPQTSQGQHADRGGGFRGSGVKELIYNDGGQGYGIKNGQTVNGAQVFSDVWAGHRNHVHVAAGPKTVVALGKLAQQLGLHVGENPHFGGVDPVHVPGSYHYKGEAIDVSGNAKQMAEYARLVERYARTGRL